ncbi:MAG: hypothetical protein WBP16_07150 [Ferruginibacter sp.]
MRQFIFLTVTILFFLSSCSDDRESALTIFRSTSEGLTKSNKSISNSNAFLYLDFESKVSNPATRTKSMDWKPKVLQIKDLCSEVTAYLQKLKRELENEASVKSDNGLIIVHDDNTKAVYKLFTSKNYVRELSEIFFRFKKNFLSVDIGLTRVFENRASVARLSTFELSKTNLKNLPVIAAIALLNKFENDILVLENETISYCYYNIGEYVESYSVIRTIVGQNSNYIKSGEDIEITVGLGIFSISNRPEIFINGKRVPLDENAVAIYKMKTPVKAGRYFVPVEIKYTDMNGSKASAIKEICYTVFEEK